MPCNSDHMQPNQIEIEASKVRYILDEIKYGVTIDVSKFNTGFNPQTYCDVTREKLDEMTRELCTLLGSVVDVTVYSLETQIWWRDHQAADCKKAEAEKLKLEKEKLIEKALNKLSPLDKEVLGIK